jgi:hypothetical protein
MNNRAFHLTLAVVAAMTLALSIYGTRAARIAVPPGRITPLATVCLLLLAPAAFYRWRKMQTFVDFFLVGFWALLLSNLYTYPMYIAARQDVELSDALLARWDRALGIEVPDVLNLTRAHPPVSRFLDVCYMSLVWFMGLTLIVLSLCGRMRAVKEYFISVLAAALISIPLFAVFRAVGPWHYYGYAPDAEQERTMNVLFALRARDWFVFDSEVAGLIAFPSFHTILALQTAIAWRAVPYLRWPAAALSALIVVSTVTTGWHYVSDVVAGVAVVLVAFAAAKVYARLDQGAGRGPQPPQGGAEDAGARSGKAEIGPVGR